MPFKRKSICSPELKSALATIMEPGFPKIAKSLPVVQSQTLRETYFWDMERDGVTQSIIQLFALCPQKAHYRMIEGLEHNMKDRALEFGSLFHEILDKVYSYRMSAPKREQLAMTVAGVLEETQKDGRKRLQQTADIKDQQEFEVNYGVCASTLVRYFEKWEKEDEAKKWLDIERIFEFPYTLRDGTTINIRGKFDGVFRDKQGKLWLFETKTKSQIEGTHTLDKMDFELQVMVYLMAMRHVYGEEPMGVVYNLIRRPQQRFSGKFNRKDENIPQFLARVDADIKDKLDNYFIRYEVRISSETVDRYKDTDLDYIIERLYEWQKGGISNFRNSAACSMWNRPCEYLPICGRNDRTGYKRREQVFPELQGVEE